MRYPAETDRVYGHYFQLFWIYWELFEYCSLVKARPFSVVRKVKSYFKTATTFGMSLVQNCLALQCQSVQETCLKTDISRCNFVLYASDADPLYLTYFYLLTEIVLHRLNFYIVALHKLTAFCW